MNLNIPSQFRQEFDRSADFAVEKEAFTPSELAEYLGRGRLSAEMMIRYMEKAELISKGKGEEVRRSRITAEEWDKIGRNVDNYLPAPEPEIIPEPEPQLTVIDIITEKLDFIGRALWAEESLIVLEDGNGRTDIALDSISALYIHKGKWFGKSTLTFSAEDEVPVRARLRADTVTFKKRDWDRIKALADALAERLEIEVKTY